MLNLNFCILLFHITYKMTIFVRFLRIGYAFCINNAN